MSIVRVSAGISAAQANGESRTGSLQSLSADGRFLVFESTASNLVSGDTNGAMDAFLFDRNTGSISRLSLAAGGIQGDGASYDPSITPDGLHAAFKTQAANISGTAGTLAIIKSLTTGQLITVAETRVEDYNSTEPVLSADGRYVMYLTGGLSGTSYRYDTVSGTSLPINTFPDGTIAGGVATAARDLSDDGRYAVLYSDVAFAPGDDMPAVNGYDLFVKDLVSGTITRLSDSVVNPGHNANGDSFGGDFSSNGQYVVYQGYASDAFAGDTNGHGDALRYNLLTGAVDVASSAADGTLGQGPGPGSWNPVISGDGRYVAFQSTATNLVSGDNNGHVDIFVKDMLTGAIVCISRAADGTFGNGDSYNAAISADGRTVAFTSDASNLVAGDTNAASDVFAVDLADLGFWTAQPENSAPTFSIGDGKVTTAVGTGDDEGRSVAIQSDGKIVVAGRSTSGGNEDFAVARYNADGSLDTTFSGDGKLTTAVRSAGDAALAVTIQTDGKLLVAGYSSNSSNEDFALLRYLTDGSLDATFGTGGVVTTPVGAARDFASSVTQQPDGKILVAGWSGTTGAGDFALVRYNSDGSIDTAFGSGGKVVTSFGAGDDFAYAVAVQPDGKIILAGDTENPATEDFALARYNADGTLDTSFSNDGKVITAPGPGIDLVRNLALQADGKILVAGVSIDTLGNERFAVARYLSDGTLDNTFATSGLFTTSMGTGAQLGSARSIAIQTDGKILAAGLAWNGSNWDFGILRLTTAGTLDTSFGAGGKTTIPIGTGHDIAFSIDVQTDGKIVLAGVSSIEGGDDFALLRLNRDGSLDASFDGANTLDGAPAYTEGGAPVVLDSNVSVYDAELSATNYNGTSLTLMRHGGPNAHDQYGASGILAPLTEGAALIVSGTTIGAVTQNSGGKLLLSFNAAASQALIDTALRSITYANTSEYAPVSVQIDWTFSDGNQGLQGRGGYQFATGSTTVAVSASNAAPSAIALSINHVNEFAANGTSIGLLSATDSDGPSATFTLVPGQDAGGRFVIVGNELRVADGLLLDFEQAAFHTIRLQADDGAGGVYQQDLTISVGNVNPENVQGDTRNNKFVSDSGNDTLAGGLGNDTLTGGTGADTFVRDGYDTVAAQADVVSDFTASEDKIDLGPGGPASFEALFNHLLRTSSGGDAQLLGYWNGNLQTMTLTGVAPASLTAANFVFDTSGSVRNVTGTSGADLMFGGLGDDTLTGGDGSDMLVGDDGNDSLSGGNGTDRFDGGAGADTFSGGAGLDRVDYNAATTLILNASGVAQAGSSVQALGDTFIGIEHIRGSSFDDNINVSTAIGIVYGHGGNDTLTGGAGTNQLNGDDGNDEIHGGGANGTAMVGDVGGSHTVEVLYGGAGNDTIYAETLSGQTILVRGDADNDTIFGGAGNDALFGDGGDDTIDGGDGNDNIFGGVGADTVSGGIGNDIINDDDGMSGDHYSGGDGNDGVIYATGTVFDFSAVGADVIDSTVDYVRFTNAATVTGSAGIDRFNGTGNNSDSFSGLGGNDWLLGWGGNDHLDGGANNDRLDGGLGADTIRGGSGGDNMTGGNTSTTAGDGSADVFLYFAADIDAADVINDFIAGTDKIGLDAASFGLTAGALTSNRFMTLSAYQAGGANSISGDVFAYDVSNGYLFWDAEGTTAGGLKVMAILKGTPAIGAGDFVIV